MELMGKKSSWDLWIEEALPKLESRKMFTPIRPMNLSILGQEDEAQTKFDEDQYETFQGIQPWDRLSVQISLPQPFFQRLMDGITFSFTNFKNIYIYIYMSEIYN